MTEQEQNRWIAEKVFNETLKVQTGDNGGKWLMMRYKGFYEERCDPFDPVNNDTQDVGALREWCKQNGKKKVLRIRDCDFNEVHIKLEAGLIVVDHECLPAAIVSALIQATGGE